MLAIGFTFDPEGLSGAGSDVAQQAATFDWAVDNGLAVGGNTAISNFVSGAGTTTFATYLQTTLANVFDINNASVGLAGLNTDYEFTLVARIPQQVTAVAPAGGQVVATFTLAPGETYLELYADSSPDADSLAGTGFNDTFGMAGTPDPDAQLILTAQTTELTALFLVSGATGVLDQFGTNNYPGLSTVIGNGSYQLTADVTFVDPGYFPDLQPDDTLNLEFDFNGTLITPFSQVDPSARFLANTSTTAAGVAPVLAGAGNPTHATYGIGSVNGAAIGSGGGPSFQEQFDANSSFTRELQVVSIQGYKWHDADGDATWDVGEPGLNGWTVYLDLNNNDQFDLGLEPFSVTANDGLHDGAFSFSGLAPGTYTIREVLLPGWEQTFPGGPTFEHVVTLDDATPTVIGTFGTAETPNFGNNTEGLIIITPDKATTSLPYVHVVNQATGELVFRFLAYEESYRGGVRVATGDVTGDGVPEIITAPGLAHTPLVKVFSIDGTLLYQFLAFSSGFNGGVDIAVGDVDGDGANDIAAAMSYLGSQVAVFRNTGTSFVLYKSVFAPFGSFKGGATVELADMGTFDDGVTIDAQTPDGKSEIIVGNQSGMRSTIFVMDYSGATAKKVRTYLPFDATFRGGISLDVARVDNSDLIPDIIVGAGIRGGSQVVVLNGLDGSLISSFVAYPSSDTTSWNAPVRVAAVDNDGDGIVDLIMTAQGSDGTSRKIRSFEPLSGVLVDEFLEDSSDFMGAYFLADL